jgi:hypothetical protein
MRNARTGLLVIACALVATTAPAGAVVGGEPVAVETVPWFAEVNGCGACWWRPTAC